jgi:ABC-type nitrate/sulfonate/bicarbonate transport system substrate-binding protein
LRARSARFSPLVDRRRWLLGAGAVAALGLAEPARARTIELRIASNQGVENASLQRLMFERGFFRELSIDARLVESSTVSGPMIAVQNGEADLCMISAFPGVLPAIAQGAPLRLVGSAMRLPALALYSARPNLRRLADLPGCRIGVGPKHGLLHILMLALLHKHNLPAAAIRFVNAGSNAQVLTAVARGDVDAGLSGTAGLSELARLHVLDDGRLWRELPEYTYQTSFASLDALQRKPEAIARGLAAYVRMFRFLSAPSSLNDYLIARGGRASAAEAKAVWRFIQDVQPYALDVGLPPERVAYLQALNAKIGLQQRVLAFEDVADMAPARAARALI